MFQTEIILFLQSFSSDFFDGFFKTITEIGRPEYSIPLFLILIFGCHFRFGFMLVHVTAWSGLITMGLKEICSLPRPVHVDLNVKILGESYKNSAPFISRDAGSFWGYLPDQVVEYYRIHPPHSWGFPSGHTSHALTLWGSTFLFFKRAWIKILAGILILLIPLSRMYLGRHFLADILGGYVIGSIFVAGFYFVILRRQYLSAPVFPLKHIINGFNPKVFAVVVYFFGIPWLVLLLPSIEPQVAGAFLGLNIGFLLVWIRGIPSDKGTFARRVARVLLAGGIFAFFYLGLKAACGIIFSFEPGIVAFLRHAATQFFLIWGATEICVKLGLYRRNTG